MREAGTCDSRAGEWVVGNAAVTEREADRCLRTDGSVRAVNGADRAKTCLLAALGRKATLRRRRAAPTPTVDDRDVARRALGAEVIAGGCQLGLACGVDAFRGALLAVRADGGAARVAKRGRPAVLVIAARPVIGLAGRVVHADPASVAHDSDLTVRAGRPGHGATGCALARAWGCRAGGPIAAPMVRAIEIRIARDVEFAGDFVDACPAAVAPCGDLAGSAERSLFGALKRDSVVAVDRATVGGGIESTRELSGETPADHLDRLSAAAVEDLNALVARKTIWRGQIGVRFRIGFWVLYWIGIRIPGDVGEPRLAIEVIDVGSDLEFFFGIEFSCGWQGDVTAACDNEREQSEEREFSLENHG